FLIISCGNKTTESASTIDIEGTQQFVIKYPSDTINYLDVNGHKQGLWIDINTKEKVIYKDDTAYTFTDSTVQDLVKMLNKK
ncbi:MAG TPA: hypothetical protein VJI69_02255, partial [Bacteroidia bacterium]|nr:hypothetical protein [Bacteroidia bacterium]